MMSLRKPHPLAILLLILVAGGLFFLSAWQVQRLFWKESGISK